MRTYVDKFGVVNLSNGIGYVRLDRNQVLEAMMALAFKECERVYAPRAPNAVEIVSAARTIVSEEGRDALRDLLKE